MHMVIAVAHRCVARFKEGQKCEATPSFNLCLDDKVGPPTSGGVP